MKNNNDPIEFRDIPNGGDYCTICKKYIYSDMLHAHRQQHREGFYTNVKNKYV